MIGVKCALLTGFNWLQLHIRFKVATGWYFIAGRRYIGVAVQSI